MFRRLLQRLSGPPAPGPDAERRSLRGLPVTILNSRPDIRTDEVMERLAAALDLIASYAPHRYRRLRQDLSGFVVKRFACRGAFFPDTRECLVELTFTVNPAHGLPEIAASIVHEATHARVATMCGTLPVDERPREERLCRRAELEFGLAVPGGEVVVQRAQASLLLQDAEVAPAVDWAVAARRVAEVDARRSADAQTRGKGDGEEVRSER